MMSYMRSFVSTWPTKTFRTALVGLNEADVGHPDLLVSCVTKEESAEQHPQGLDVESSKQRKELRI